MTYWMILGHSARKFDLHLFINVFPCNGIQSETTTPSVMVHGIPKSMCLEDDGPCPVDQG